MSLFSKLLEYTYADMVDKQRDITSLFPTFHDRVRRVDKSGGVLLTQRLPDVWHFKVASAAEAEEEFRRQGVKNPRKKKAPSTGAKKRYDVYVRFKNIYELLKKYVPDKSLWVQDGSKVDRRKLADALFRELDIETSCSCPASLYWGSDFIRSTPDIKAQYGDQEDRPPVVRNPSEHGSLCKHGDSVFDKLPVYKGTLAKHLEEYYGKTIKELEDRTKKGEEPPKGEPGKPVAPKAPPVKPGAGQAPKAAEEPAPKPTEEPEVKVETPEEKPYGAKPGTKNATGKITPATQGQSPATTKHTSATSRYGSATGKA